MKKLLTLLLAAMMVLSFSLPAFAITKYDDKGSLVEIEDDAWENTSVLTPGVTYKFKLTDGSTPIDDAFMEIFKTTLKVESGREYISSVALEKIGTRYYLVITPKSSNKYLNETHTVEVWITAREKGLKSSDYKEANGDIIYPEYISKISFEIGFADTVYLHDGDYHVDNESPLVTAGDASKVKLIFGEIAEFDARFGTTERYYNLSYNTSTNDLVLKNNPSADMRFVNFIASPSFVANSNLRVYMKNAAYLYEIKGGELVELDATKGNGYMEYRTSTLTSYVVSDRKLVGGADLGSSNTTTNNSSSNNTGTAVTGKTLSSGEAQTAVTNAVAAAKAGGDTTATVRLLGVGEISQSILTSMRTQANMPVKLIVDTMTADGKSVDVRLSINPYYSVKTLNFTASTTSQDALNTKKFFQTWFSNNLQVVSLSQKVAFGQTVSVAARVDLTNMNTSSLYFYAYNSSTNKYDAITAPAYYVDTAGYLHFNTTYGGDIVVTSGPLKSK